MKLQDMPILDRLYPGAGYKSFSQKGISEHKVTPGFFRNIAEFKRFKLDHDLRIPTPKGAWEPEKIFGHLMLPFPKVWIEWENRREDPNGTPPWWMAAACVHKTELTRFMVELFGGEIAVPPEKIPERLTNQMLSGSWSMFMFELTTGTPRLLPAYLVVELDDDGVFRGLRGGLVGGNAGDDEIAALMDLGWDALAAIGWLNCRNVTTQEHDRSSNVKRRRRPNRDKAATLNFNTIKLPGMDETRSSGRPGEKTETVAMHMARGHFKTFTEEAPLFGKYTGTYWWGWQVRGNRKNGITVSDYKMEGQMSA